MNEQHINDIADKLAALFKAKLSQEKEFISLLDQIETKEDFIMINENFGIIRSLDKSKFYNLLNVLEIELTHAEFKKYAKKFYYKDRKDQFVNRISKVLQTKK